MKGLIILVLLVSTLVYCAMNFIPIGKEGSTRASSQTTTMQMTTQTIMHIDNRIARNLE